MKSYIQLPYRERVRRGLVDGTWEWTKFGKVRADSDAAFHDVWQYGSDDLGNVNYVYPLDGTAPINRASSSVVGDTQLVKYFGLDIDGNWVEDTFTLTGQTPVDIGNSLWRCFTAYNMDPVTSPIIGNGFAGNIHFYADTAAVSGGVPTTPSDTKTFIQNGYNRTLQSFWTCPAGYTASVDTIRFSLDTKIAAKAALEVYVRPYGLHPQVVDTGSISSDGTSIEYEIKTNKATLSPRADFIPRISMDTNDTSVSIETTFTLTEIGKERNA